jgi:hypothetical protein
LGPVAIHNDTLAHNVLLPTAISGCVLLIDRLYAFVDFLISLDGCVVSQSSLKGGKTTMNTNLRPLLVSGMVLLMAVACQLQVQRPTPSPIPVDVEVPQPPTPVNANGQLHLLYELHITNFDASALMLTRVDILGNDVAAPPLASYQDAELISRLERYGLPGEIPDKRLIGGGLRAVVYLQLILDAESDVPSALHHRLSFLSESKEVGIVEGARVVVEQRAPLVIGPPLQGEGWLAINGLGNTSGHRRALIAGDGKVRIAQRFATDWVQIGADGQLFHGDPAQNENWYGYGVEALAVADGVVVDVQDGIPENMPLTGEFAVPITLETLGGNYVIVDVGGGNFAFYAHLQPQSLRVKIGAEVQRGQALGLLGNSGNSDAPHLHFHITDANSAVGAEGIPYVFESFEVQGMVESLDSFESGEGWRPAPAASTETRQKEIPVENAVIRFP